MSPAKNPDFIGFFLLFNRKYSDPALRRTPFPLTIPSRCRINQRFLNTKASIHLYSLTIFSVMLFISGIFFSMSATSFSCVRQRSRFCSG